MKKKTRRPAPITLPRSKAISPTGRLFLLRALRAMQRYPQTLDMSTWRWHDYRVLSSPHLPEPYCGTTACLAGHIVLAAGVPSGRGAWLTKNDIRHADPRVRRALQRTTQREYYGELWIPDAAAVILGRTSVPEVFNRYDLKTFDAVLWAVQRWLREEKDGEDDA